jgi:hypothetical protein
MASGGRPPRRGNAGGKRNARFEAAHGDARTIAGATENAGAHRADCDGRTRARAEQTLSRSERIHPAAAARSTRTEKRGIIIVLAALFVLALGLYFFFTTRADRATHATALFQPTEKTPAPNPDAIRDKATAELKEKIARLPSKASPPQQNFFYDINVNMQKSLSEHVPWWAVIRGGENVINPETQQTILRTDFILTVEYRDGEWTFKHYRASASDMVKEETKEIEEDEKTPMPPSIVGMLGLKLPPAR